MGAPAGAHVNPATTPVGQSTKRPRGNEDRILPDGRPASAMPNENAREANKRSGVRAHLAATPR